MVNCMVFNKNQSTAPPPATSSTNLERATKVGHPLNIGLAAILWLAAMGIVLTVYAWFPLLGAALFLPLWWLTFTKRFQL